MLALVAYCAFFGFLAASIAQTDHLVPLRHYAGNADIYTRLWQKKLLVTPGDLARYVHLPSDTGVEDTVSLYVDPRKQGGLPGAFWLTGTQPRKCLADFTGFNLRLKEAQKVEVRRWDAPIRESTARRIHEVWVAMLKQIRPHDHSDEISTDITKELFSAEVRPGVILTGQLSAHSGQNTISLVDLGGLLTDYTRVPPSLRKKVASDIDKAAVSLLERLERHSGVR